MYNIHIRNYKDICCYMNLCANNHYLFLPLAILLFSSIVIFIVGIIIIAILYTHLYIYIVHIGYYLYIYIYIYTYIPQTKTSTCFTDVPFFRDPINKPWPVAGSIRIFQHNSRSTSPAAAPTMPSHLAMPEAGKDELDGDHIWG